MSAKTHKQTQFRHHYIEKYFARLFSKDEIDIR